MTVGLAGRAVLVTGASRGLGEVIAGRLLAEGARVMLAARSVDDLERVRGAIDPTGERTGLVACDVAEPADCEGAVAATIERFGAVDILVNNAGIEILSPFAELELTGLRQIVEINVIGLLQMTRAALPHMLERGSGQVVNMASLAGLTPVPYNAVYSASKHAVVGFTDSLRIELDGTGVGVSAVCPGFVREAGMFAKHSTDAPPLAGTSSPAEVADAVVKAIKHDRRNIVVAAPTAKLSPGLRSVVPGLYARMMRLSGVTTGLEQAARRARSKSTLS